MRTTCCYVKLLAEAISATLKKSTSLMILISPLSLKKLEQGRQGVAVRRNTKPNMVTKIFGFNDEQNGYLKFVKAVMENPDNPYLPCFSNLRVYDKPLNNTIQGDKYDKTGVVDMEKLIPLHDPRVDDAVTERLRNLGVRHTSNLSFESIRIKYMEALAHRKDPE